MIIKIVERTQVRNPIIWINIHERGFKNDSMHFGYGEEVNSLINYIELAGIDLLPETKQVNICIYDDLPASSNKSIGLICEDIDTIKLARAVQIKFNHVFGSQFITVTLI